MASPQVTDRAQRYRAQKNVTGPRKCVICGSRSDLQVMHLDGNESHGEKSNLAYGCRSCNGKLSAAFKRAGIGRPTNQYNPAGGAIPTFEQYMWAVSNHERKAHDAGGAVIHATPKHKRIEYARRIASKAQATKRERFEDRWNPAKRKCEFCGYGFDAGLGRYGCPNCEATRNPAVIKVEKLPDWKESVNYPAGTVFETANGQMYRVMPKGRGFKRITKVRGGLKSGETLNPWPFSRPDARRTTPASGGIAHHMAKAGKRPAGVDASAGTYKGYRISRTADGEFFSSLDPQSWYSTKAQVQRAIDGYLKGRANPAAASAEVFEEFHGFAPSEVVTVTKKVFHHAHLAAAGKLTHLDVWGIDERGHHITGFKGAILAFNESKNQLFVEGGDQSMDLKAFGIRKPHELETLGRLTDIGYQTNKTHLGDEGGAAVYVHKFRTTNDKGKHVVVKIARYPDAIYDVPNEQILFSGGSYEILREGINK